jgi:hypothetical protein
VLWHRDGNLRLVNDYIHSRPDVGRSVLFFEGHPQLAAQYDKGRLVKAVFHDPAGKPLEFTSLEGLKSHPAAGSVLKELDAARLEIGALKNQAKQELNKQYRDLQRIVAAAYSVQSRESQLAAIRARNAANAENLRRARNLTNSAAAGGGYN